MMSNHLPYITQLKKQFMENGRLYPFYSCKLWLPNGKQKRVEIRATSLKQAQTLALQKKMEIRDQAFFNENAALFNNRIPMEEALKQLASLVIQGYITENSKRKKPLSPDTIKKNVLPMLRTVGKEYLIKRYRYLSQINEPNFREKLISWIKLNYKNTHRYYDKVPQSDAISNFIKIHPDCFEYSQKSKSLAYIGTMSLSNKNKYLSLNLSGSEKEAICNLYNKSQTPDEISISAINNKLKSLKSLLDIAVEKQWLKKYPTLTLLKAENKYIRTAIPIEDIKTILQAAPDYIKFIFYMFIVTGLRKSELFEIKVTDLDYEKRILHVKVKKSRNKVKFRVIRLPSETFLWKILEKLRTHHFDPTTKQWYKRDSDMKDQWLFMSRTGVRIMGCRTSWSNLMKKLNFHYFPHLARHSFVTFLRRSLSPEIVRDYIAHESLSTLGIYDHTNVNNINLVSEDIINQTFGNLLSPAPAKAYEQT